MLEDIKQKEETDMLDIIMVAVLAACCGSIALLIHWCQKQVDQEE